jgi:alkyldihydroxyacetonephosphate synthase
MTAIAQMEWGAWGVPGEEFSDADRPGLRKFIERTLRIDSLPAPDRGLPASAAALPEARANPGFAAAIRDAIGAGRLLDGRDERLVHAYGKSYRDLWRARRGLVDFAPDAVIYPNNEHEVAAILAAAAAHGVSVVPFGGGTNITGCVELRQRDRRMAVTIDMRRMGRLVALDAEAGLARIEAGATGPAIEEQLGRSGFTLGHFPDSFVYSTLGGWLATRSAGMKSDGYGNIEDMVAGLRMVTPAGTVVTRALPHSAAGIDVTRLAVGSEGTLGVITEATMRARRIPRRQAIRGYLFPSFRAGIDAVRACVEEGCGPTISRLNDPVKTQLSFAYAKQRDGLQALVAKGFKTYLRSVRGVDLSACCLHLAGFEGSDAQFRQARRRTEAIYRRHGAVGLGASPGRSFSASKYEYPLLRDWAMDRGIIADASETAIGWGGIQALYDGARESVRAAMPGEGMVACHLSHSYRDGASLYFTYAMLEPPEGGLEACLRTKRAAEDAFLRHGATLSHHHAVGWEHLPWLAQEASPAGLRALGALRAGLDPAGIMNPGKLADGFGLADWGLPGSEPGRPAQAA